MIDLSQLPPPDVVEPLDFETLLAERKARLLELTPEADRAALAAALELESEPITILLQENAYREALLRQHINDAARAVMLASAAGADLTNLGALFGVARQVITPADTTTNPPTPAVFESDASLRARIQLAPESYTSCGTFEAYRFHALAARADVLDAAVLRPEPGTVRIVVLSAEGDGTPSAAQLADVLAKLQARDLRSVNDTVEVAPATVRPYYVQATLTLYPGPAAQPVIDQAQAALAAYAHTTHRLGYDVSLSGIYAALHQPGVQRVTITTPAADIVCAAHEAPHLVLMSITAADDTDV